MFKCHVLMIAIVMLASSVASAEGEVSSSDVFASINGEIVTVGQLAERLRFEYQKKFYHGQPPAEEVEAFQEEMTQRIIDEVLLVQEAKRRKLSVAVEYQREQFLVRTAELTSEQLEDNPEFVAKLKSRIDAGKLLELLEEQVRAGVKLPSRGDVIAYYNANQDKFTTPSKDHVGIILLGVPAYAGTEAWSEARGNASNITEELRAGASFSEMARIHSSDESASAGGDMGFIHSGMLGGAGEQVVSLMSAGEISEPVMLLEGVAIFQLVERSEAVLNDFSMVEVRASGLLQRDQRDAAWDGLIEGLRADGDLQVDRGLIARLNQ